VIIFFLDRNFRVLPNALHEYLPTHHAGLIVTDVDIAKCSSLNIFSSCKLDPAVWHRIEKDLYLGMSTFSSAYVHVRRKREEELTADDKVVVDLTVGRLDPSAKAKGKVDERWEARTAGLWVKRSSKKGASDSKAREGWAITGTPLLLDTGSSIPDAHITIRRGGEHTPVKPTPRVNENGRFKIMQLADLHLSTGVGHCRDALPPDWNGGKCEADPRTLDFVAKILEEERPDLVVLSGDQVNGDTAPDTQTVSRNDC
jgi:Calcineurin-like phosphoesterase